MGNLLEEIILQWLRSHMVGTERCGTKNSLNIPNCVDECCAGPGERRDNKLISEGKAGDLSASQGAHLYTTNQQVITRAKEAIRKKRREMVDEMSWRTVREMDIPPDPGARHLARYKVR